MADITLKLKRGVVGGVSPPSLTHGELAVNTTDERLFVGGLNGQIIPFNKTYVGASTPQFPVEGDYWFDGDTNYAFYGGSWVGAGGGGGFGGGGTGGTFTDTTFLGDTNFLSQATEEYPDGTGGNVIVSGNLIVLGNYPGACNGINPYQTFLLNSGMVVTGGAVITQGLTAYGFFNLNGSVTINGVDITALIVGTGSSGVGLDANTFIGLQSLNAGLTTNHIYVSKGATFAQGINVTGNSIFNGNLILNGRSLNIGGTGVVYTSPGIYLAPQSFNDGLSASTLFVSRGATFRGGASVTGGMTAYGSSNFFGTMFLNGNPIGGSGSITLGTNFWVGKQYMNRGISADHIHVERGITCNNIVIGSSTRPGGLTCAGRSRFTGRIYTDSGLETARGLTVNGTLRVYGISRVGTLYSNNRLVTSDRNLKENIEEYTDSKSLIKKWVSSIRNNFVPYSFNYILPNVPLSGDFTGPFEPSGYDRTVYGYMADELQYVDPKLVSFIQDDGGTAYGIDQDQLLFGAIEAIRELDAEVCRLWKFPTVPPPSRAKDNDLWFNSETSKMYMRLNDGTQSQWIQIN